MRIVLKQRLLDQISEGLTKAAAQNREVSHIELTSRELRQVANETGLGSPEWASPDSPVATRLFGHRVVLV